MGRLVSILLLAAVGCFGQVSQNVIFQQVISSASVDPTTSAPVNNIGQTFHYVMAGIRNASGHTCSTSTFNLSASASNDNINYYIPLSANNTPAQLLGSFGGSIYIVQKQLRFTGAYPYIKVSVNTFDTTNCVIDAFYTGTLNLDPFIHTPQTISARLNTSGDNTLITTSGNGICIVGLVLYNSTAAQTVILKSSDGTAMAGMQWDAMPAGAVISLPLILTGGVPYAVTHFTLGTPTNLVANLANNTAVTITVIYYQF